jgi:hypothetical protein
MSKHAGLPKYITYTLCALALTGLGYAGKILFSDAPTPNGHYMKISGPDGESCIRTYKNSKDADVVDITFETKGDAPDHYLETHATLEETPKSAIYREETKIRPTGVRGLLARLLPAKTATGSEVAVEIIDGAMKENMKFRGLSPEQASYALGKRDFMRKVKHAMDEGRLGSIPLRFESWFTKLLSAGVRPTPRI